MSIQSKIGDDAIDETPKDDAKTYDEWNALGRQIIKGSKAIGFRDKKPLFLKSQTSNRCAQRHFSAHLGITGPWDDMPH